MGLVRTILAVIVLLTGAASIADGSNTEVGDGIQFNRPLEHVANALLAPVCFGLGELFDVLGAELETESTYWYRRAAERGHVVAQARVGERYSAGIGVDRDKDEAARWWRMAGAAGNKDALAALVTYYRTSDDIEGRIHWTRMAADAGIADGQYRMGWYYYAGDGVPKDQQEKIRWYKLAAAQGHKYAQYNLAYIHAKGLDGVTADYEQAYTLYMGAAEQDLDIAIMNLYIMLKRTGYGTPEQRRAVFEVGLRAAESGDPELQHLVGGMYHDGIVVEQNYDEAAQWFLRAAQGGHKDAQFLLGDFYDLGRGVEANSEIATFWHTQSANQGYPPAQYRLANRLAQGFAAPVDPVAAFDLMLAAAKQEHAAAQFQLGEFYLDGVGVEIDIAQARYWFGRAAQQGLADAMHNVFEFSARPDYGLLSGVSYPNDSFMWLYLAADAEVPTAKIRLQMFRDAAATGEVPGLDEVLDRARKDAQEWRRQFLADGGEITRLPELKRPER